MTELHLSVEGWPPAKSEALSLFNEKHPHHDRVEILRRTAERALLNVQWNRSERRSLGLELVVVKTPTMPPASDATNYLGGVADVLQLFLYYDDSQVQEVHYSVESGASPAYRVRIWVL